MCRISAFLELVLTPRYARIDLRASAVFLSAAFPHSSTAKYSRSLAMNPTKAAGACKGSRHGAAYRFVGVTTGFGQLFRPPSQFCNAIPPIPLFLGFNSEAVFFLFLPIFPFDCFGVSHTLFKKFLAGCIDFFAADC
jgi:hypothetical protein